MADAAARQLQYEYKAVSAEPRNPGRKKFPHSMRRLRRISQTYVLNVFSPFQNSNLVLQADVRLIDVEQTIGYMLTSGSVGTLV